MKIKRNAEKKEKFYELCSGTVFLASDIPYLKVDGIATCEEGVFNAMTLETGEFVRFGGEDLVHPCYDAELFIP